MLQPSPVLRGAVDIADESSGEAGWSRPGVQSQRCLPSVHRFGFPPDGNPLHCNSPVRCRAVLALGKLVLMFMSLLQL